MRAIRRASIRERRNYCPIPGYRGAIETSILQALERRGFIAWDSEPWKSAPRVTDVAIAALHEEEAITGM